MTLAAARRDDPTDLFASPAIVADRRADDSIILKSSEPLRASARCVGDWLVHWVRQTPERIFLAERGNVDAPWTTVNYRDALRQVRSIASWILAQRLSAERPLVILSDNSVDHALLALAAMHVGVPSAAISPAYSLMSKDFDKLKSMIGLLEPARSMSPAPSRSRRRLPRSSRCIRRPSSAATPAMMARFHSVRSHRRRKCWRSNRPLPR